MKNVTDEMFELYVKEMSFSDLHALFLYISGDFNRQFGTKINSKQLIHSRYNMVLEELNDRAYGGNPYSVGLVDGEGVVNGEKPEDIDLSKFEEK